MGKRRKKLSLLLAVTACVASMSVPAMAGNSYLDVRLGDRNSYWTTKDDGERNYYITPQTYIGKVMGRSVCSNGVTPSYKVVTAQRRAYSYQVSVYPGKAYRLQTYGKTAAWHLTGTYCP